MPSIRRFLIGERTFYREVIGVVAPIIVQTAITNFVSLLDNLMVGQVGTQEMSGVAIANTLMFVFYLCIFGAISGASIFGAQFAGAGDHDGVRSTFRYKIIICVILVAVGLSVFIFFGRDLIRMYLTDTSDPVAAAETLRYGSQYLTIMLVGMLPFAITSSYAGTLRETGQTRLPMMASIMAVVVNLAGNYILIFGHFGSPALGVRGAAIATVFSRFVELAVILVSVHKSSTRFPVFRHAWGTLTVPKALAKAITSKSMPLLLNECLWSLGMAKLAQLYSLRGLSVVAGFNISDTVVNLFNVVYMSMGNAAAIIVGQQLGANDHEEARRRAWHIISLALALCLVTGLVTMIAAPLIPRIYNTNETVRSLASSFIRIYACFMPLFGFSHCAYFILRSGGKTLTTFLFDCGYTWGIMVPMAAMLIYLTNLKICQVYSLVLAGNFIKCVLGFILVKKGIWIQNIVRDKQGSST
jgi:putative MATE family efflux protein